MAKDITLVIVENRGHDMAKFAIEQTLNAIDCKHVLNLGDKPLVDYANFVKVDGTIDIHRYSTIVLKELCEHVTTDHLLIVQWDGMAVNRNFWTDDFLKYDYIGAIWPWVPVNVCMGNGGFSLRSRKLIEACQDSRIKLGGTSSQNEDVVICVEYRAILQEVYGINYAPINLARQFSTEHEFLGPTFGFHGIWNIPRFFNNAELLHTISVMPDHVLKNPATYSQWTNALIQNGHGNLVAQCAEKLTTLI